MKKYVKRMAKMLSIVIALAMVFQLVTVCSFAASNPMTEVLGTYEGYYYASQGQTGVTLTVYKDGNDVKAIFEFYNLPNRSNAKEGSFYMDVSMNDNGTYYFKGVEWIDRPSGYNMVNVNAGLNGYVLSGNLTMGSSYTFYAEKPNNAYQEVQENIYNGHRYEVVEKGWTWTEAEEYAEDKGGYLVVINDASEQVFVQNLIRDGKKKQYWIGGFKNSSGEMEWVNCDKVTYTNYDDAKPEYDNEELSAFQILRVANPYMPYSKAYKWNDSPDDNTIVGWSDFFSLNKVGFIIEYDAYSNSSDWAGTELEEAYEQGLIPDVLIGKDMSGTITRGEFAAVACKLYEQISGNRMIIAMDMPFKDIDNAAERLYIMKAYNYDIVNGTSATTYSPDDLITREQMAAMLTRAYKKFIWADYKIDNDSRYPLDYSGVKKFNDDREISAYAYQSVYFMSKNKIINGMGNNMFAPKNTTTAQAAAKYANATREQALLISSRTLNQLGDK